MATKLPTENPERVANGDAIREIRRLVGYSVTDLARRIERSRAYVSNIEAGRKQPAPETLRRIADVLGVPLSAITIVRLPCRTCSELAAA